MSWWHKFALGTIPVVGIFTCILLFQAGAAITTFGSEESRISYKVEAALDTINAKCGVEAHCGTLAEVDKTLTHTSDLVVQSQLLVRHADQLTLTESKMLPEWNTQLTQTLNGVNYAVGEFGTNEKRVTEAVIPIFGSTNLAVQHVDGLVTTSTPLVESSLKQFEATNVSVASSSKHLDATLSDVQFEADKIAHPSKKKLGFWASVEAGGDFVRHFMPAIF